MGIFSSLVAAACLTWRDIMSKQLSTGLSDIASALTSFVFALPFYLLALLVLWIAGLETFAIGPHFFLLICARGLTDAFAEYFKMCAFSRGDLSLVAPLLALAPVFVLLFFPFITGDPLTSTGILSIACVVLGSLIITWQGPHSSPKTSLPPESPSTRSAAIGMALLGAFFLGLNSCFDRLAVQAGSAVFAGFSMTLFVALLLTPCVLLSKNKFSGASENSALLWKRGALETAAMCCKLFALQYLSAPLVVALLKSSVIFSVIGGRVIFRDEYFYQRLFGAFCITAGIFIVLFEGVLGFLS